MKPHVEDHVTDIVKACSVELSETLDATAIRPIGSPVFKEDVSDATSAFLVDGHSRKDDCVLILSNPHFPDMVDEAATKAREAQSALDPRLSNAVCTPLLTGRWDGRSYAVFKRLDGFARNRYLKRLQVLSSERKIFAWLSDIYRTTKTDHIPEAEQESAFLSPLQTLSSDKDLDDGVRRVAEKLAEEMRRGRIPPVQCLQHGDFWLGNILFHRSPAHFSSPFFKDFEVIDWAGSRADGYPGMDALRFSTSAFGKGEAASKRVRSFNSLVGLSDLEFSTYCVCSLGWLASNLNQFPKKRFDALTADMVGFLRCYGFVALP